MGNDVGYFIRQLASDETNWEDDTETWNLNSFAVNFESTENNPYLSVDLLLDPFASIIDLQLMDKNLEDDALASVKRDFSLINVNNMPNGGIETYMSNTYLGKAKKNPELYRWLKDKAEQRNAETKGIGDFINFLDVTSEQMTDEQRSVPKANGIDVVGIAKIGISNPIYMWQGRRQAFERSEYHLDKDIDQTNRYSRTRNEKYKQGLEDTGINITDRNSTWTQIADSTILIKPESDTKFISIGRSNSSTGGFVQMPNAKFLNMGSKLANADQIIPKKNLKAIGAIPTKTWGPRQVAALAPTSKLTNKGKPWIKSIQEFKMPDGIGINSSGWGSEIPSTILPPGTGYLITLNPISNDPGPKKRVDGKLVRQRDPYSSMMSVFREKGLDLPWEFTHDILDYSTKENQLLIYFANNRVAYLINPMSNRYSKYNLKQDDKKALFFDEEYGLFPQLKPIFDEYTKSNKWLRENQIHAIMSKIIFEGLGDKAYYDLQKKKSKPNYGQLVFLNNIRLTGSYSNEQLKAMGFFMKNGSWAIQKPKYDRLVSDGKLKEMINRPLKTGTNKIPKVGKRKVTEGTWSFDEEGILELLKKPLLRGGDNEDVDLSCEVCQGHGCGSGYDIKDDLRRWKDMLNPEADNRPEHLTNEYIQGKIKKLEALVNKFPKGIPDNIDCSAGMSNMKHREWMKNKNPEAEDVLYSVFGDDSLFDDMSELDEDDDVRPIIMARLKELDPTLHEKALSIYKDRSHLRVVKEGKNKIPKVGEKKITEIDVYDRHKQVDGEPEEYTDSNEVEKQVMKSMHKDEIKKMLSDLTDVEKIVIIARFGLDNGKDYDLIQVGDMIGKSRERVRQIEAKALRKMRTNAMRNLNPEHIDEGKKLPRTSEFLHVKELEDIKRLSGVYDNYQIPVHVEGATSASMGSNISKTASEISKIMKEKNIQPGTPEWFQLWFSKPYLTGEKPTGKD
jgi:RNA polymerase sigma factor (sigma-70 family)